MGGALSGLAAGIGGGGLSGAMMSLMPGGDGNFLKGAFYGALYGGAGGLVIGGLSGYFSTPKGFNKWNGNHLPEEVITAKTEGIKPISNTVEPNEGSVIRNPNITDTNNLNENITFNEVNQSTIKGLDGKNISITEINKITVDKSYLDNLRNFIAKDADFDPRIFSQNNAYHRSATFLRSEIALRGNITYYGVDRISFQLNVNGQTFSLGFNPKTNLIYHLSAGK